MGDSTGETRRIRAPMHQTPLVFSQRFIGVETCKVDVANDPSKALLKENREILCGPLVHCDVQ